MNIINITQKQKNKHLSLEHYEYIIGNINKFNIEHKGAKRNIGKTAFIKKLANDIGTTVSNIYTIINDATITVRDSSLNEHLELSAYAAFTKRSAKFKIPNNSKLNRAHDFIKLIEKNMDTEKVI